MFSSTHDLYQIQGHYQFSQEQGHSSCCSLSCKWHVAGHSLETCCREGFDQLIYCMPHSNHDPLGKQQAAAGHDYCLDDHFLNSHCLERAAAVFQCSCHLYWQGSLYCSQHQAGCLAPVKCCIGLWHNQSIVGHQRPVNLTVTQKKKNQKKKLFVRDVTKIKFQI